MDLRRNTAQSAVEYMMTYGWVVIAMIITILLLYVLGIFDPATILGAENSITGTTLFSFTDFLVMPDGNVTLYMRSESPIRLNVTGIALGSSNLTGLEPSLPIELAPGQSINVSGGSGLRGQQGGSFFTVKLRIYYSIEGAGNHTDSGTMSGRFG